MDNVSFEKIVETRRLIKENLAQNPSQSDRFFSDENRNHLGENYEKYIFRDEFTRDTDRIVYSKAFRRMEHKAQVFSNKKGDHYRTRLTHSLEVAQISKSISRNMGLNVSLSEAIALGHDIGHTPFGHAGERLLDMIMRGEDDLDGHLAFCIDYGGFKHNLNSVKILEVVEKRKDTRGLNLTWQTLDGILKHTNIFKEDKKWDISRFVRDISNYSLIAETNTPLTLEGQVVAISDEIAQVEHDLDDSLRDHHMLKFADMVKEIKFVLEKVKPYGNDLFDEFYRKIYNLGKIESHIQWAEVINIILSYLIVDICENSIKCIDSMDTFDDIILKGENNRKYIIKPIISSSPTAERFRDEIQKFIGDKIIHSGMVNKFDNDGKYILRHLFKAYYENPKLMPKKQLMILFKNIDKISNEFPDFEAELKYLNIDLNEIRRINEGNIDLKILELAKLNLDLSHFKLNDSIEYSYLKAFLKVIKMDDNLSIHDSIERIFDYCNKSTVADIEVNDSQGKLMFVKALCELHYSYLAIICEYISEMTDDYAVKEYDKLILS